MFGEVGWDVLLREVGVEFCEDRFIELGLAVDSFLGVAAPVTKMLIAELLLEAVDLARFLVFGKRKGIHLFVVIIDGKYRINYHYQRFILGDFFDSSTLF
jgi:hypothetical protein